MANSYTTKTTARRAARAALNAGAVEGVDFDITATGNRFTWLERTPEQNAKPALRKIPKSAAADPDMIVGGVLFPNKTLAGEAKRLLKAKDARRALAAPNGPEKASKASGAPESGQGGAIEAKPIRPLKLDVGQRPSAPDFSKPTHKAWLKKHAEIVALADADDLAGLRAYSIEPKGSSRRALVRYRDAMVAFLSMAEAV